MASAAVTGGEDELFYYERADGTNAETTLGKVQGLVDAGELVLATRVWTPSLGGGWMTLEEAIGTGNVAVVCSEQLVQHPVIALDESCLFYEVSDGENKKAKLRDLQELLQSGVLKPNTSVWTESFGDSWMSLGEAVAAGIISADLLGGSMPEPEPEAEPEAATETETVAKLYYELPDGENEEAELQDVQALLESGVLKPDTSVWTESFGDSWMSLGEAVAAGKICVNLDMKSVVAGGVAIGRMQSLLGGLAPDLEPEKTPVSETETVAKLYYELPDGANEEAELQDVQALLESGVLKPDTSVWTESFGDSWMSLGEAVAAGKICVNLDAKSVVAGGVAIEKTAKFALKSSGSGDSVPKPKFALKSSGSGDSVPKPEPGAEPQSPEIEPELEQIQSIIEQEISRVVDHGQEPERGTSLVYEGDARSDRENDGEDEDDGDEGISEFLQSWAGVLGVNQPAGCKKTNGRRFSLSSAPLMTSPRAGVGTPRLTGANILDQIDEANVHDGMLTAVLPAGIRAGEILYVTTPDLEEIEVVVPDGIDAGDEFDILVMSPSPRLRPAEQVDQFQNALSLSPMIVEGSEEDEAGESSDGEKDSSRARGLHTVEAGGSYGPSVLPATEEKTFDIEITGKAGSILTFAVLGECSGSAAFFLEVLHQANVSSGPLSADGQLDVKSMRAMSYILAQATRFIRRVKEVHRGLDGLSTFLVQVTDEKWAADCHEDMKFTVTSIAHGYAGDLPSPGPLNSTNEPQKPNRSTGSAQIGRTRTKRHTTIPPSFLKVGLQASPKTTEQIKEMERWKERNLQRRAAALEKLKVEREEQEAASVIHPRLQKRLSREDSEKIFARLYNAGCASMTPSPRKSRPHSNTIKRTAAAQELAASEVHERLHALHAVIQQRHVARSEDAVEKELAEIRLKQYGLNRHKEPDHDKEWHMKLQSPTSRQLRMMQAVLEKSTARKEAEQKSSKRGRVSQRVLHMDTPATTRSAEVLHEPSGVELRFEHARSVPDPNSKSARRVEHSTKAKSPNPIGATAVHGSQAQSQQLRPWYGEFTTLSQAEQRQLELEDQAFMNRIARENEILQELSIEEAQRNEAEEQRHRCKWLQELPVFHGLQKSEADVFFTALAKVMEVRTIQREQIIVAQDQILDEMYFVKRGKAEVVDPCDTLASAILSEGNFFGEDILTNREPRQSFVRAKSMMQVYVLRRDRAQQVLDEFPNAAAIVHVANGIRDRPGNTPPESAKIDEVESTGMTGNASTQASSDAEADVSWQPDDAIIEELHPGNGQEQQRAESLTEAVEPERHGTETAEREQQAAVEATAREPDAKEQADREIHAAERGRQAESIDREIQLAAEQEREAVAESAKHALQQQHECSVDPLVSQTDTATALNDALDGVALHAKVRQCDATKKQADLAASRCRWCQCQLADKESRVAGPDGESTLCGECGDKFIDQQVERPEEERTRGTKSERLEREKEDKAATTASVSALAASELATATVKAKLAVDFTSIETNGEDEREHVPQLSPSLAMSVEDWLGMHGAADCAPNFRAEGIETLEEIAFVMQTEGDIAELGVTPEQAALLWPTVVAAQNGELSTVKTTEAAEHAEPGPKAAVGVVPASTPQAEADVDPFAELEKELDAGMPSSLY